MPSGGERNSGANPHGYVAGTNCTGIADEPPTINITSPANNASFTEPATINIQADATDAFSTINSVVFYSGADSLGKATAPPYQYNWSNVPAGNYTIGARATAADSLSAISSFVNVVVNIDNSAGFCATLNNGDFSYRAEKKGDNVVFIFHPLAPIAGCAYALIYVRQGLTGGYPGYPMSKIGNDFRFVQTIPDGTPVSIYFTYQVPSGGENNSSATPQDYTVGTVCSAIALPVQLLSYTASVQNNSSVAIAWSSGIEINNDYFIVQKSNDGVHYTTLAKQPAGNVKAPVHYYTVVDASPAAGTNYYRLQQFNKDGGFRMYGVKTVTLVNGVPTGVYPNPIHGTEINVRLAAATTAKQNIRLLNMEGKLMYTGTVAPIGNMLTIHLPSKPSASIYMLSVAGNAPVKILVY